MKLLVAFLLGVGVGALAAKSAYAQRPGYRAATFVAIVILLGMAIFVAVYNAPN